MLPIPLVFFISLSVCEVISGIQTKSNLLPGNDVCGKQVTDVRPRVVYSGVKANIGEYPWLALLVSNDGQMDCAGALISNRYVLTAAHCVDDEIYPVVAVRLGEHNLRMDPDCDGDYCANPVLNVEIEDTIIHENYIPGDNLKPYGDIALLRLKEKIDFTDFIRPICLPSILPALENDTFEGKSVSVAGWGKTERSFRSYEKLQVDLLATSHDDCVEKYRKNKNSIGDFNILRSHICAKGSGGQDSCRGDSGSPLMYMHTELGEDNWICVGVVSYGPKVKTCEPDDIPGVYTRLTEYTEWIVSKLKP